jgi:ankyrin repeat protein
MKFGLYEFPDEMALRIFSSHAKEESECVINDNSLWEDEFIKYFTRFQYSNPGWKNNPHLRAYPLHYAKIISNVTKLRLNPEDIASVWEMIVFAEDLESIKNIFKDLNLHNFFKSRSWSAIGYDAYYNRLPPLHLAALLGNNTILHYLIERGMSCDTKAGLDDCTPLHCAAKNGHIASMELLIAKGVDLQATDSKGKNIINYVLFSNSAQEIEFVKNTLKAKKIKSENHSPQKKRPGGGGCIVS